MCLDHKKTLKKTRTKLYNTLVLPVLLVSLLVKLGLLKQGMPEEDEIYEKNSRIHLDKLQDKYTNYKGIKNNTSSRQITGIQEKLDTTRK